VLVIRLQRTGRKNLSAYRIVVAEKARAVKKQSIDTVGHYLPTQNPKVLEVDQKKVLAWIAKGAQYIGSRDKKRKSKNAPEEEAQPVTQEAPATENTDTPAEEAPAAEEAA